MSSACVVYYLYPRPPQPPNVLLTLQANPATDEPSVSLAGPSRTPTTGQHPGSLMFDEDDVSVVRDTQGDRLLAQAAFLMPRSLVAPTGAMLHCRYQLW